MHKTMIPIKFKKVHPDAIIPKYQHDGDSGFDAHSVEDVLINPGEMKPIPTGLAVEIPYGYEIQCRPRSGLVFKHGVIETFGTIDSNFRGSLTGMLHNCSNDPFVVHKGDRVFQYVLAKVELAEIMEVTELSETGRSTNGYGSTGVK